MNKLKKIKYFIFRWYFVYTVPFFCIASIYSFFSAYSFILPYLEFESFPDDVFNGFGFGLMLVLAILLTFCMLDVISNYFNKLKAGKIEKGFLFMCDADLYCDFCTEKDFCSAYKAGLAYPCVHSNKRSNSDQSADEPDCG